SIIHFSFIHTFPTRRSSDLLARSREDDVAIVAAIRAAGAQIVSVTENIDETPTGVLLHGIMASVAEFYSLNLATEIMKGLTQKADRKSTRLNSSHLVISYAV